MKLQAGLYFESHVTIDPVFDADLDRFRGLACQYGFRVASLLMRKGDGVLVPSVDDTFCTSRGQVWEDIKCRTRLLVSAAIAEGFTVRRYKIEDTLLDVRL